MHFWSALCLHLGEMGCSIRPFFLLRTMSTSSSSTLAATMEAMEAEEATLLRLAVDATLLRLAVDATLGRAPLLLVSIEPSSSDA